MSLNIKHLLFILLCFSIPKNSFSQNANLSSTFGEGSIVINEYFVAPDKAAHVILPVAGDAKPMVKLQYFIKDEKILRNDSLSSYCQNSNLNNITKSDSGINEIHDSIKTQSSLNAKFVNPPYLIDWRGKIVHAYSPGKKLIAELPLEYLNVELFYRLFGTGKSTIDSLSHNNPVLIAGEVCYKGFATNDYEHEKFVFYFTKTHLPVLSPLNCFLPADFPYNVMSVSFKIDWTLMNGKKDIGRVIYQVSCFDNKISDDSIFDIPKGTPIKKNITLLQLYSN